MLKWKTRGFVIFLVQRKSEQTEDETEKKQCTYQTNVYRALEMKHGVVHLMGSLEP